MKHNEQLAETFNRIFPHRRVIVLFKDGEQAWGQFLIAYPECVIIFPVAGTEAVAYPIDRVRDIEADKIK